MTNDEMALNRKRITTRFAKLEDATKRVAFARLSLLSSILIFTPKRHSIRARRCALSSVIGGDADYLWARIFAQYMGKYMRGNAFIVQNMTGGGGFIAAHYVYGVAKPDGLTLACWFVDLFRSSRGAPRVQFDWSKFTWYRHAGTNRLDPRHDKG